MGGPDGEAFPGRTDDAICVSGREAVAPSAEIIAGFALNVTFRDPFTVRGSRGVFSMLVTVAMATRSWTACKDIEGAETATGGLGF
jgi:hypothetical protein